MPLNIVKKSARAAAPQSPVGYRRPPVHTRFAKGVSGNPKGRPKGARSYDTVLAEELIAPIQIIEKGRKRSVPKSSALFKMVIAIALSGDLRAMEVLLKLLPGANQANKERYQAQVLDLHDQDILLALREQLAEQIAQSKKDQP